MTEEEALDARMELGQNVVIIANGVRKIIAEELTTEARCGTLELGIRKKNYSTLHLFEARCYLREFLCAFSPIP